MFEYRNIYKNNCNRNIYESYVNHEQLLIIKKLNVVLEFRRQVDINFALKKTK